MTEFRRRNFHEEGEEVFDFSLGVAPWIARDRSLLFAIVSTGHCIRVEGSRSRIEVAAGVLSVSHLLLSDSDRDWDILANWHDDPKGILSSAAIGAAGTDEQQRDVDHV